MRDARHMERRGVSGSTGGWRGAPGPAPRTGPASGARQGPAPTHRDYRTFQGRPRTGRADAYGFPQRFRGASWVGARRLRLVAVDQVAGPALGAIAEEFQPRLAQAGMMPREAGEADGGVGLAGAALEVVPELAVAHLSLAVPRGRHRTCKPAGQAGVATPGQRPPRRRAVLPRPARPAVGLRPPARPGRMRRRLPAGASQPAGGPRLPGCRKTRTWRRYAGCPATDSRCPRPARWPCAAARP